jgi:hypothetical protein
MLLLQSIVTTKKTLLWFDGPFKNKGMRQNVIKNRMSFTVQCTLIYTKHLRHIHRVYIAYTARIQWRNLEFYTT